ncbi:hypothetical protein MRX96_029392 [Rhipicephalus microplus]
MAFLWVYEHLTLPKIYKKQSTSGKVLRLWQEQTPGGSDYNLLQRERGEGASEPALSPPEKILLTREISRHVTDELRPSCLSECVDVLAKTETCGRNSEKDARPFAHRCCLGVLPRS